MKYIRLDTTQSTNAYLKELAKKGEPDCTVVVSAVQTCGRGRFDRSFESPPGGLYMSFLTTLQIDGDSMPALVVKIAELVKGVTDNFAGVKTDIKPINDIYLDGKKLCGILCESFTSGDTTRLIIGIGMNVNTEIGDLSCEVGRTACSLYSQTNVRYDIDKLCEKIADAIYVFFRKEKQ